MGRPQRVFSDKQRQEITAAYRASKDSGEKKRLLCLVLRMERGLSSKEIAAITGHSEMRVRVIFAEYNRDGLAGILHSGFGLHQQVPGDETEIQ